MIERSPLANNPYFVLEAMPAATGRCSISCCCYYVCVWGGGGVRMCWALLVDTDQCLCQRVFFPPLIDRTLIDRSVGVSMIGVDEVAITDAAVVMTFAICACLMSGSHCQTVM